MALSIAVHLGLGDCKPPITPRLGLHPMRIVPSCDSNKTRKTAQGRLTQMLNHTQITSRYDME